MKLAGLYSDTKCLLCVQGDYSCEHLFFKCLYGGKVRHGIIQWLGIRDNHQESLYTRWKKWRQRYKTKKQQMVCYASLAATVYHLWKTRNQTYWNYVVLRPKILIKQIQVDICIRVRAWISNKWSNEELLWFNNLCIAAR